MAKIRYVRKKDLVWEKVEQEVVVLDHQAGKIYRLNETAGKIWSLLSQGREIGWLVKEIEKTYQGKDIEDQLEEVLKTMEKQGIVVAR